MHSSFQSFLKGLFTLFTFFSPFLAFAQVTLLKDVNPGIPGSNPIPYYLVNNKMLFLATTPTEGEEFWVTDGTTAGTTLLKDIFPGPDYSNPMPLQVVGNTLYFIADDGVNGAELWKSNGTSAGTVLVKDLYPGGVSGGFYESAVINGKLIFATYDQTYGMEIWSSDGTSAGTAVLKDLIPGIGDSYPQNIYKAGSYVFFTAIHPTYGRALYKTDGTPGGTVFVKEVYSSTQGALFYDFTSMNGNLYFYASADSGGLWKSDGTPAGTIRLKEISVNVGMGLNTYAVANSKLFFAASEGMDMYEPWLTDGTPSGTVKLKDINPGMNSSDPMLFTSYNNIVYFSANDGVNGLELWRTDGTPSGTYLLKDINAGASQPYPISITGLNNSIYFYATDATNGEEFWKSDGTVSGTILVKDIYPGPTSSSQTGGYTWPYTINNAIYFYAVDQVNGVGFWKSDGTTGGTILLKDVFPGADDPVYALGELNGTIFFTASDNVNGLELWKYNACTLPNQPAAITGNSTVLPGSSQVYSVAPVSGATSYVWTLPNGWTGSSTTNSISVTVGNNSGVVSVSAVNSCGAGTARSLTVNFNSSVSYSYKVTAELVKDFTALGLEAQMIQQTGNKLLVYAKRNSSTMELWSTDGTSANTVMVSDQFLNYDYQRGYPGYDGYITLGGKTYLGIYDSSGDAEPFVTDGTPGGTYMLANLRPSGSSVPTAYFEYDGAVFFGADSKLYKHDGVSAPVVVPGATYINSFTIMNNDLYMLAGTGSTKGLYKMSGANGSPSLVSGFESTFDLQTVGNKVIFWAEKSISDNFGYEVYVSDGTPSGTILLADLVAGNGVPVKIEQGAYDKIMTDRLVSTFVVFNGYAYFSYQDPTDSKCYLMKTDGTPSGTTSIFSSTSYIRQIFTAGNRLIFNAFDAIANKRYTMTTDGVSTPEKITNGNNNYYSFDGGNIDGSWGYDENGSLVGNIFFYENGTSRFSYLGITDGTNSGTKAIEVKDAGNSLLTMGDADDFSHLGNEIFFLYGRKLYKINQNAIQTVIGVEEYAHEENKSLLIYPNPVTGNEIYLDLTSDALLKKVVIYNMLGEEIFPTTIQIEGNRIRLELPELKAGIYQTQVYTDKGMFSGKFVK